MEWPNFHHLLYFWTVAREGSIMAACKKLYVSQPTISAQLRALERSLGHALFTRRGRRLELTEMGHVALRYADEIFTLGRELTDTLQGRPTGRGLRLVVGVADVVPKLVAYRLLEPALQQPESVELVCLEGKSDRLLADLAVHELDLVLSDAPVGPSVNVRAFSHLLGECGTGVFATPRLARRFRKDFPAGLAEAPLLLPTETCTIRRELNQWFFSQGISPRILGQFDDSALLTVFGQAGRGVFFAPAAIAAEMIQQYGVVHIGTLERVRQRFYAISVERRIRHPAVLAISTEARRELFR
jgi:LysR family transcriptional activator of nhaA